MRTVCVKDERYHATNSHLLFYFILFICHFHKKNSQSELPGISPLPCEFMVANDKARESMESYGHYQLAISELDLMDTPEFSWFPWISWVPRSSDIQTISN